jgi:hypothetical protein
MKCKGIMIFYNFLSKQKSVFKKVLEYDLYTRHFLPEKDRTIEHIVPNRLLTGYEKVDPCNLYVIDKTVNRFRSDYRFGGSIDEILETIDEWENIDYRVFRNRRQRLFFPMYGRPLVARTCRNMLHKYEHLQDVEGQIMISDDVKIWMDEDMDRFDENMEYRRNKWSVFIG